MPAMMTFLVGAYVFEDVGVTAYHGAASLLTVPANLVTAAGILAVEAYHAGLIRTTINYLDPTGASIGGYTNLISTLRASLSKAGLLGVAPGPYDSNPDDYGLATSRFRSQAPPTQRQRASPMPIPPT
jgi:hypothetical protein